MEFEYPMLCMRSKCRKFCWKEFKKRLQECLCEREERERYREKERDREEIKCMKGDIRLKL